MTSTAILDALNAAGEALKGLGHDDVTIGYNKRGHSGAYNVSLGLSSNQWSHGFGDTPELAYHDAKAKAAGKAKEMAIRARVAEEVEARVRAELQQEAA